MLYYFFLFSNISWRKQCQMWKLPSKNLQSKNSFCRLIQLQSRLQLIFQWLGKSSILTKIWFIWRFPTVRIIVYVNCVIPLCSIWNSAWIQHPLRCSTIRWNISKDMNCTQVLLTIRSSKTPVSYLRDITNILSRGKWRRLWTMNRSLPLRVFFA